VPPKTTEKPKADQPTNTEELEQLRAQVAGFEEEKQRAVQDALDQRSGAAPTSGGQRIDLSEKSLKQRRERYADWPAKGGSEDPQPWDLAGMGLLGASRDFEAQTKPGTPDNVSPIVISHSRPLLTYGSSDPSVHELGRILGALGFPNSVSDGHNAYGSIDNTVMAAVFAFRDAYGVQEDPSAYGGDTPAGREQAAAHIGPWTWEAVLRAGQRLDD
jgi:hypothetical protein